MNKLLSILLTTAMLLSGCRENRSITDSTTKYDLPRMEQLGPNQLPYQLMQDGMLRSEQYAGGNTLVVDPHFYDAKLVDRGDVIYYKTSATDEEIKNKKRMEFDVARVIALPGETVTVQKGQVYINGHRLDTFYGKEYYDGKFINGTKNSYTMPDSIDVPPNHYILAGDVWWRVGIIEDPVSNEDIRGGVVGWIKKEIKKVPFNPKDYPMHF
ncbi:S26 family signal peptidase [Paenibacillus roseipurpureus]|uniref:S26 family signal peptidase n=1 Tax=Paenibacillus roseopurpureus TaxID=2918901 RepID=A0AA96LYH5_9BACL|nr:S26 family signal peptidase [Paenibacillus sp. MBLB1832]WNR46855.1 S26 family signal peptidase [Paenibacillus sp. MBLB1832]